MGKQGWGECGMGRASPQVSRLSPPNKHHAVCYLEPDGLVANPACVLRSYGAVGTERSPA